MRERILVALGIIGITGLLIAPNLHPGVSGRDIDARKLEQMARQIQPEDQPEQAQEFFTLKRSPDRISPIPGERYLRAIRKARRMPQHSTPRDAMLPSEADMARTNSVQPEFLGSWTQLGPGNIGGRTRAIVINPSTPTTMYAAGVAGGVWRTTNGGSSWAPLTDLIANIAVNSLAMDPGNSNIIYAGTGEGYFNIDAVRGAGIFKTTDGGNTWTSLSNTVGFHFVNSIVVSPNNSSRVYAGTEAGVMKSTDGGSTWTNILNPSVQGGCLQLVIRTDQSTDYLLASCGTFAQATVYRNTDAAGSGMWSPVLSNTNQGLTSLAIAPSSQGTMYALAASNQSGNFNQGLLAVYRSTDGGATWVTRVDNTSTTKLNTLLLTNPIIASLHDCGLASLNSFESQGWYDNVIAVDPVNPNRVWAGGIDLFKSDDGGANWGIASYWWAGGNPVYAHADQHAIVFQPGYNGTTNQTMFVGNDGGIFKTTNAAASTSSDVCGNTVGTINWTNLNNNYGATQFYYGVSFLSGTTYFGGTQDNGTDLGTDGGGILGWSEILGGDGGAVAVDSTNTNVLYAENTGLSIAKSTNGGSNWTSAISGITENPNDFLFISPFIMDPSSSQRLWTGGSFLWRTTNGASSWTQASAVTPGNGAVSSIAVAPSNANMALAGLSDGFIVRTNIALTSTSSTTWASAMPRSGYVAGLTFDPANANVAYAAYSTFNQNVGDNHIYKSSDAGATWTGIDGSGVTGLPDVPAHCVTVDPHNSSRLYVGTDLGVFVSIDGGANWARENTGFANVITESLTVNTVGQTSTLFAFTHGRGAWRVTIPSLSNPDTIGLYSAAGGAFFLRFSNTAGFADNTFSYGPPNAGWIALAGDWNGDGIVTPGLYNPATATWFLRNSNSTGVADLTFSYGPPNSGWIPIVGDWDGNGTDTVGLYDPVNSTFFLRNTNSAGVADLTFAYGPAGAGWLPIAGHWNGPGADTIGLYNPAGSSFFLRFSNTGGFADVSFGYGPPGAGWMPIVGDWDGNGTDTVGLFASTAAVWFLRNSNTTGVADVTFSYGFANGAPLTGRWH
jgi:photosystem II stability/assembly factor-like uncharacterized protein